MRWEDDHEWCVVKDLEEGGLDLLRVISWIVNDNREPDQD